MLNELYQAASQPGVLTGIAAVATVVAGYFIKRKRANVTLTIDERKQLSMDEQDFRKSILCQLKAANAALFAATNECTMLRKLNNALEKRISELETNCFNCIYKASKE